jgi:hypothetical protein
MSHEVVTRSLEIDDMHVERTAEGRTIVARALSYGTPYRVTDDNGRTFYNEVWRAGVFAKSIAQRAGKIPLLVLHQGRRLPIGATIGIDDSSTDFVFRAKVSRTRDGDEALELVQDGALTGVSVGARILNHRKIGERAIERIEAALNEISLAPSSFTQMPDGLVLAVRALVDTEGEPLTTAETLEPAQTPALDDARAYLAALQRP